MLIGSYSGRMGLGGSARAWLIAYALAAATELVAEIGRWELVSLIALALCMPTLLGFLLTARTARDRLTRLVGIALVFSWCGDMFGFAVLVKIAFFGVAQLCYAGAFWPYRARSVLRRRPPLAVLYGLVILGIVVGVAPAAGRLAPAVIIYAATIGTMALLATGLGRLGTVGAAIFIVSDTLIAVTTFVLAGPAPAGELPDHGDVPVGAAADRSRCGPCADTDGGPSGEGVGGRWVVSADVRTRQHRTIYRLGDRTRRDAAVDEQRPRLSERDRGDRHHPRSPGRRGHFHRHLRHLRADLGCDGRQRAAGRQGPAQLRQQHRADRGRDEGRHHPGSR